MFEVIIASFGLLLLASGVIVNIIRIVSYDRQSSRNDRPYVGLSNAAFAMNSLADYSTLQLEQTVRRIVNEVVFSPTFVSFLKIYFTEFFQRERRLDSEAGLPSNLQLWHITNYGPELIHLDAANSTRFYESKSDIEVAESNTAITKLE